MYRRDLLTAEIQKLAQALARMMGLKLEGKLEEAENELNGILEHDFGILLKDLLSSSESDFALYLDSKDFPSEKLDMLSQLLYSKLDLQVADLDNQSLAGKLLQIYQLLESKHHVVNMISLDRQKLIRKYLNENLPDSR